MALSPRYITVAVSGPLCRTFTYRLPAELEMPPVGQRVVVPFGRRTLVGYHLGPGQPVRGIEIKSVQKVLDHISYLSAEMFSLCQWISEYYVANPADCLSLALPTLIRNRTVSHLVWSEHNGTSNNSVLSGLIRPGKKIKEDELKFIRSKFKLGVADLVRQGIIQEIWPDVGQKARPVVSGYRCGDEKLWEDFIRKRRVQPASYEGERSRQDLLGAGWTGHLIIAGVKSGALVPVTRSASDKMLDIIGSRADLHSLSLTPQQQGVCDEVTKALTKGFSTFLLHGITGSGKTLVYCHIAQQVLAQGKTVLILTPEIALAGAMLGYVRGFFGDRVTILHSAMSESARLENWQAIHKGECPIVVGPRSALFAPLPNLGLIIVDEEHDGSYKQDDPSPRFHGRDAAIMRAQINKIPVLLGSASPSVESYHQAKTGKYQLLELTERPAGARLPTVRIVDLRENRLGGDLPFMSFDLKKEVERRLEREEQVILFLNRRGYSARLKCGACGHVPKCPTCDVHMTYHKAGGGRLACHYCGMIRRDYQVCEKCGSRGFLYLGAGTQKLEESMGRLFERANALRFDSDAAVGDLVAHRLLSDFANRKYNLLLGTQMVTKGLDLPHVSLVGVLSADHGLDLPDFRASEKTFSRLLQVAGRSGRTERGGEVIIQTYYPDNEVINMAARQDYQSFFVTEIIKRKEHDFPPFVRLANIEITGESEEQASREALSFRERLEERAQKDNVSIELMGPAPCPYYFLKGVYRRHLLVKTKQMTRLSRLLALWETEESHFGIPAALKIRLDIDPVDMM